MTRPHVEDGPDSMSPDEWELVKELVFDCQSIDADARHAWLAQRCADGRVRREVERLLALPPITPSFMGQPAPARLLGIVRDFPFHIGRFRITHELGVGGMGVVYAATDEHLGRAVALKVLRPDIEVDDERRDRLLWDARAASALNHPHIVSVFEAGEEDGVRYIAMELVRGKTLAEVLAARVPPPREKLLRYAIQIASALEAAHSAGLIHRDLKPGNIMVTDEGIAKLMDFGLAKSVSGTLMDQTAPQTIEGRLAGTVAYMSPEQAEGTAVDFRSDIFSFGSLIYEMLTLRPAFSGASGMSVLAKVIHEAPSPVRTIRPDLDARLEDIVNRCLRKDRERRFQSMGEVRVRLQEATDRGVESVEPLASERPRTVALQRIPYLALMFVIGATIGALRPKDSRPAPTPVLSKLTWDGGLTTAPAISHDGTLLAYVSDRAGRGDLDVWIQRVGGSDPIRLTDDPADESAPAFSPDGTSVAYRSERDGGGVYVVPSLGGTERLLVRGGRNPVYSPDGKWMACWTGNVGGAFYRDTASIVIIPSSGGQPRRFRPDFENAAFPVWTPDGRGLIFLGRKTDRSRNESIVDWWIAPDASDGERATGAIPLLRKQRLSAPDGAFWLRPEAWLDGHRTLLFAARHADATNVWGLDFTPRMTVSGVPYPLTLGAGTAASPRTSTRDHSSFLFANTVLDVQLRKLPLSTFAERGSEPERLLPSLSQIGSPSISTNGRVLIFSVRQPGGYRVMSADTASAEQRTVTAVESRTFVRTVVSGDGTYVVYSANQVGYRIGVRNGVPEAICARCGWPTHVNHDGTQALFESAGEEERLLLWSQGELRPLVAKEDPDRRMQFGGRFSPDGRWVTFCAGARASGERQIVVVPKAPERTLRPDEWITISDGSSTDREPYWSPDRRRIFFLSDRDGFRCIWARPVDPATAHPVGPAYSVAHFHHARELLGGPAAASGAMGFSASHDALIFAVTQASGNVWRHDHLPPTR